MQKMKNLSQQKPILFSLVVCCAFFLCLNVSRLLFSFLPDNTLFTFIKELFNILWPVALTILFGFRFIYAQKGFGSTLKAGMSLFLMYAIQDASGTFESMFTVTAVTSTDQISNSNLARIFLPICLFIFISLFLLRKSKQPAIFARLEQLRTQ